MLEVSDINVYYGNIRALHDVSFNVGEGEIVTLIGANGAGKSTILKTISGLLRPKTGDILFDGGSIIRTEPHAIVQQGLAHVPEGRRIFLSLSVEENLEMGAYTRRSGIREALDDVYARFPRLAERSRQIAGTLSGGEQQMLAMGRALMIRPRMMMLDEPSMGLAPLLVKQIFDIIRELNAAGTTILLVEQNARMALSVADRGYVLESGRIVLADTAQRLFENDSVKKAYLGG
ncbi:MAG: ABC transporter ATP-binding protein [Oscillospiraceae bacterium]|nr:ABC transporter ATP-binding protein [Oscillospiraceae bacterium]